MGKTVGMWGRPGSGKSTTVVKTAPRPLLVYDIDKKIKRMGILADDLKDPDVIVREMPFPLVEETLLSRVKNLAKDKPPQREPKGYVWIVEDMNIHLPEDPEAEEPWIDHNQEGQEVEIQTVFIDSYTRLCAHMKRYYLFHAQKGSMTIPGWGSWLSLHQEFFTGAMTMKPHFIIAIHEKTIQDEITGEVKVLPSIEGQFAEEIVSHFEEFYHMEKQAGSKGPLYKMLTFDEKLQVRTSLLSDVLVPADLGHIQEES